MLRAGDLKELFERAGEHIRWQKEAYIIRKSGLFDEKYYLRQYPDVSNAGIDPIWHYVTNGWKEGRDPSATFSTDGYFSNDPEIAESDTNPLIHWIGWASRGNGQRPPAGPLGAPPTGKRSVRSRQQKSEREIEKIRIKLLDLGFRERAYSDLNTMAMDGSRPLMQKLSAWELALWHANRYSKEDARQCLDMLAIAAQGDNSQHRLLSLALVEAGCHDILGDVEAGRRTIDNARSSGPSADLYFAAANMETSIPGRIGCINKAFELAGLSEVSFDSDADLPPFDCLRPHSKPIREPDGAGDSPKVTVIVPVYNAEKTIRTALDSTLSQTWTNLEILVVDDCSSDDTAAIVREYEAKDHRVTLMRAKINQGTYIARNIALREATGDFVTCHDSDDWFHPEKIEIHVRHLLSNTRLLANLSTWVRATDELKLLLRRSNGLHIYLNMSSLMFRREPVVKSLGYWDSVRFGADTEYYRRIRTVFGNSVVEEIRTGPLSFGRASQDSLTGNRKFGYPGYHMGARKEYRESYLYHHGVAPNLYHEFPLKSRLYPVPEIMRPSRDTGPSSKRHFNIVFVSDFRIADNAVPIVEEINARKGKGLSIGLIQLCRYETNPRINYDKRLREIIDGDQVQMVVYGEAIRCDTLIVRDPRVLQERQRHIPDVEATEVAVVFSQTPDNDSGSEGVVYDIERCSKHLQEYFGKPAVWYPCDPELRDALHKHHGDDLKAITLAKEDWSKVVNEDRWKGTTGSSPATTAPGHESPSSLGPGRDQGARTESPLQVQSSGPSDLFIKEEKESKKDQDLIAYLRRRMLSGGFSERASSDLRDLSSQNENPSLKRLAAWELALWHADKYTQEDARRCLELLAIAARDQEIQDRSQRISLLEGECYDLLGDREAGKRTVDDALSSGPSADLYLAAANLETSISGQIDCINKALNLCGIPEISHDAASDLPPFDCLRPGHEPGKEPHTTGGSPAVTVIVPAYNAEKTIRTALDSILAQTWSNLEVLVVDDCSTDATVDVVEKYVKKDARVHLIRSRINQGPYVAQNIALKLATGVLVTCHGADDWSHPEKIEQQALHLIRTPEVVANTSELARARDNLKFYRRGNPGFYIQSNMSSLMFRRNAVMDAIGYWDSVRFGGDGEFLQRLLKVFGQDSIVHLPTGPLSFSRQSEDSLTGNAAFGFPGYYMGARKEYRESFRHYHDNADSLFYGFPQKSRLFPIPEPMRPGKKTKHPKKRHFDVIIASDFRLPGGTTSSNAEEIKAQRALGLNTGLVQIARYSTSYSRPITEKVRCKIDGRSVQMIVYGEEVTCDLLIVRGPPTLQDYQDYIPAVLPLEVRVIINGSPFRDYGDTGERVYDFKTCSENLVRYFGQKGVWHPVGPQARSAVLKERDVKEIINLADTDWVNIINVDEWSSPSAKCRHDRPVIGRHSRDQYVKWPGNPKDLLDAYPDDDRFQVKILGGAKAVQKVVGFVPPNWDVYPFDSMHPREFLSEIDVFVYFHHQDSVEAFARAPLEAMAAGVPVILPEHFRPLFKEAALYARPSQVRDIVKQLHRDHAFYRERVKIARDFVKRNFGYSRHRDRLQPFVKALRKTP